MLNIIRDRLANNALNLAADLLETIGDVLHRVEITGLQVYRTEIRPLGGELRLEWQAVRELAYDEEGPIGDAARSVRGFASEAKARVNGIARRRELLSSDLPIVWDRIKERSGRLEARYQIFAQHRLGQLLGSKRDRQFADLVSESGDVEITLGHRLANRYLALSVALLGSSIASAIAPPLLVITVPFCIYLVAPVYKHAYLEVKEKRRATLNSVEAVLATLVLVAGAFVVFSISLILYFLIRKVSLYTEENVRSRMTDVFGQHPRTVWILENGVEIEIPFERIAGGQRVLVRAGQMIPVDGVVRAGLASVDQHRLTGEAQPVEKAMDDQVFATTVVLGGRLEIEVQKAGHATLAGEINNILQHTTEYNLAMAQKSLILSERMILPTFGLGLVAWPFLGGVRALALLSGAPGAHLILAAPLTLLHYLNVAAHQSILVKDGRALELLDTVDTVVFDKTGTLTLEQPEISHIHTCGDFTEDELLTAAAAAEVHQSHPIARAILAAAAARQLTLPSIDAGKYDIGYGIEVQLTDCGSGIGPKLVDAVVRVGSRRFMDMHAIQIPESIAPLQDRSRQEGFSVVMAAIGEKLAGAIELMPRPRPEAKKVVTALRERGLSVCIISGDQEGPTRKLATELGIEKYFANTLPQEKAKLVKSLQEQGKTVCFVGDGINDAIALKQAEVSISLKGATTVATDTAKIVLMSQDLSKLPVLFDNARKMQSNLKRGLTLSVAGGVMVMGSVLFLNAGLAAALISSRLVLAIVLGNALLPRFRNSEDGSAQVSEDASTQSALRPPPPFPGDSSWAVQGDVQIEPDQLAPKACAAGRVNS